MNSRRRKQDGDLERDDAYQPDEYATFHLSGVLSQFEIWVRRDIFTHLGLQPNSLRVLGLVAKHKQRQHVNVRVPQRQDTRNPHSVQFLQISDQYFAIIDVSMHSETYFTLFLFLFLSFPHSVQ